MIGPSASSFTDLTGLQRLRQQAAQQEPAALEEAAAQFEALIIGMMLKTARAATGESIFDGPTTAHYLELMDQQVALDMARRGGLGLAKWLAPRIDATAGPAAPPRKSPASPAEFVQDLWPHARRAGAALGVEPRVLVAQAALETGWGRAAPEFKDGRPSFNLFGIKAGPHWTGARLARPTLEFTDGVAQRRWEQFRAYPDLATGFDDYVHLIRTSARYQQALENAADPAGYVAGLVSGGYATDPAYADKLLQVMQSPVLAAALDAQGPLRAADTGYGTEAGVVRR